LREIAEGSSILVDPIDEQMIAKAISKVVNDSKLIADLKSKSIEKAAEFSWHKAAKKMLEVYNELIG